MGSLACSPCVEELQAVERALVEEDVAMLGEKKLGEAQPADQKGHLASPMGWARWGPVRAMNVSVVVDAVLGMWAVQLGAVMPEEAVVGLM